MKKLSVLLVTAAIALSASAGVNNRIVNDQTTKVNVKEMKAKAVERQAMTFKRGAVQTVSPVQLKAMDWQARPAIQQRGETYFWDFEDAEQLNDWMCLDNDGDGYNWEYINNTGVETGRFNCHSGEGVMVSASYDNDLAMPLTPDNWLITPVVTLGKSVSFWASGQDASYAAEKFAVYVCVGNPTNINDFVKISNDKTATGNWVEYSFDLTDYEGQQGCIAIRHYNVTDMFYLNIDDVTISDAEAGPEPPEPETPDVIYTIPDNCQLYTFYRNSGCIYYSWFSGIGATTTDGKLNVAIDEENGEAYIQNPSWWSDSYDTWVKGTCEVTDDGILITVPTGQYLYYEASYGYGIQLVWGSSYVYEDYDEYGELGYYMGTEIDERTTEIQFLLADGNFFLLGSEGNVMADFPEWGNSTGMMTIYSDDLSWISFEFANVDENGNALPMGYIVDLKPAKPANPTADEWYDCGDESGFSRFYFTLPNTDVDGNMLDPEYISYSIFVDNGNGPEMFTFPAVDYTYDLYEDITEVTYDLYSSAVDFRDYFCYFYRTNEPGYEPLFTDDIGIQVYYTVDGVKNASDIVWLYGVHSSVDELVSGKTVASVRYFNVAGQEMAQPSGMTIQVTTYTDGTTSAAKVVK